MQNALRTHRPLQEGLRRYAGEFDATNTHTSEPIVHYKKDCDKSEETEVSFALASEPIVHYKKDCDLALEEPENGDSPLRTHRPLQEGLRPLRPRGANIHARSQNPSSTTRRIATRIRGVIANLLLNLRTHRPLQEGLRLARFEGFEILEAVSEPIVHYKKDCDKAR